MKRVACFCIPAHGHTNPMLPVAAALVRRGNAVRFWSFDAFEERIRATGAEYVSCDRFLCDLTRREEAGLKRVSVTEMTLQDIRITLSMDGFLEEEFRACASRLCMMTDDGSYGMKGLVTNALEELIAEGNVYDEVIAIGPVIMMKFVCMVTRKHNIKTVISMNPIMIDGTGMCGGCRLTVGGETKFACVDGPDFDGHQVDFDEAMKRGAIYRDFEQHRRDALCNLMNKEVT